jgi:WD40 repeat protein
MFLRAQDASRFIRYYKTAIESSPLQVYYSPLVFSPTESLTRKCFQKEKPGWVLRNPLIEKDWSLCLQTLEGHTSRVSSINWSPDGSRLASSSNDDTVRIWDPATGQSVSTLEGHSGSVRSIAWSPDGSRLVSVSNDTTVRI